MDHPKILIIEDDPTWQELLSEVVEDIAGLPYVVDSYETALTALTSRRYDFATVDVSLSELHHDNQAGVEVLRQIVATMHNLPTVVITGFATLDLAIEVLAELNARHLLRKDEFDRNKLIQLMTDELGLGQVKVPGIFRRQINPTVATLFSNRELEVLYYLSLGDTNKAIAETLIISVNTVKKHVQSIFTKLNVTNRSAAINKAFVKD